MTTVPPEGPPSFSKQEVLAMSDKEFTAARRALNDYLMRELGRHQAEREMERIARKYPA